MLNQYSIAICPPLEVVEQVQALKQELRAHIGWYSAVAAQAHISFDVMVLDDERLETLRKILGSWALSCTPFNITCNQVAFFKESRTVFIAPDEPGSAAISALFTTYRQAVGALGQLQNIHPHLTIGKGLKEDQFRKAIRVMEGRTCAFTFNCNNIALRRFNGRQYDITERFVFGER